MRNIAMSHFLIQPKTGLIFLVPVFAIIGLVLPVCAQERFYWSNGSSFKYRIVEANEQELKYEEVIGERSVKRAVDRENVVVIFNAQGQYLLVDQLTTNVEDSRMSLRKFYNTTGATTDLLIKATPLEVIPATIRVEDEAINYLTDNGKPASIRKSDLVAIIYKDGRHQLLREPEDAKSFLMSAFEQVRKYGSKPAAKIKPGADLAKSPPVTPPVATVNKPVLNEQEYKEYSQKALTRVEQFADYLQVIASRNFSMNERDAAIKNALKLFMPDSKIKVSSKSRKGITELNLETYLKRLKMLPYGNVEIKWSNIEYVDELKQGDDGNYYGRIVGSQTFTGFSEKGEAVKYSDVTRKDVKVKLQSYQKEIEGRSQVNWSILLGNIGVLENE